MVLEWMEGLKKEWVEEILIQCSMKLKREYLLREHYFFDTDSMSIEEILKSDMDQLLGPGQYYWGRESANNFACGKYDNGRRLLEKWTELTSKQVHKWENLDSIIVFHSLSGGTGSGFVSDYLNFLKYGLKKVKIINVMIMPSFNYSSLVIEPYNFVLGFEYVIEYSNLTIWYDNQSLYNIWSNKLKNESPDFRDINKLISYHFSSIISSIRFNQNDEYKSNEIDNDIQKDYSLSSWQRIISSLVPQSKLHFLSPSFSPYIAEPDKYKENCSTEAITSLVFNSDSYMVRFNESSWFSLSSMLCYRGDVFYSDVVKELPETRK